MFLNLSYSNITTEIPPWQAFVGLQLNDQLLYLINPFLFCTNFCNPFGAASSDKEKAFISINMSLCVESQCKPCNPQTEKKAERQLQ